MRTLLVDDHPIFTESLQFMLQHAKPDLACETAHTLASALARPGPFQLILLDYSLPDCPNSPQGLQRMLQAHPGASIVMLSGDDRVDLVRQLVADGASGFVSKQSTTNTLLRALRTILAGGIYLPPFALKGGGFGMFGGVSWPGQAAVTSTAPPAAPAQTGQLQPLPPPIPATQPAAQPGLGAQASANDLLTPRQLDCLLMAAQGKSNKMIAADLYLGENTVKAHVQAAFKILGVNNRMEAVFKAAAMGLLPPTPEQRAKYPD